MLLILVDTITNNRNLNKYREYSFFQFLYLKLIYSREDPSIFAEIMEKIYTDGISLILLIVVKRE